MKFFQVLFLSCILLPGTLFSQSLTYVHYDTKDGLAGSTVYDLCQDRDGFIWFATDNGLTRYDGTNFKNFTVKDGLPDNEVLKVFADSKGRVWVGCFSDKLCFYQNGKIHTAQNDSLVSSIHLSAHVFGIVEDDKQFVGFITQNEVGIVTDSDRTLLYSFRDVYKEKSGMTHTIHSYKGRIFLDNDEKEELKFDNYYLKWIQVVGRYHQGASLITKKLKDSFSTIISYNQANNAAIRLTFPGNMIAMEGHGDTVQYISTTNGAWNINTTEWKRGLHFLPGKKVAHVVKDREDNLWFATLGEGVFKLPSQSIGSFIFEPDGETKNIEVFCLGEYESMIAAGTDKSRMKYLDSKGAIREISFSGFEKSASLRDQSNRLGSMLQLNTSSMILGFDKFLIKLTGNKPSIKEIFPVKSIEKIDDQFIIVGTRLHALKIRLNDMAVTDTIWKDRCTKVFYHDKKYYIGTLKGLYEVAENKSSRFLGDLHYSLTRRIVDMKSDRLGILWIATSDNGIVAYKEGKIYKTITDTTGLSSNNCKTIFLAGRELWVGTDKGINKVDVEGKDFAITKYSTSDGLPSNSINAVYVKDGKVWVGSPAGLTYFNENDIAHNSICNLVMLGVYVSEKEIDRSKAIRLHYNDNNISFNYAGISLRSGGEITYYYRVLGLDTSWKQTSTTTLDYRSLPQGNDYELQLYAVNKYGVKSQLLTFRFSVSAPFWKSIWFYALVSLVTIAVTFTFFYWRKQKLKQDLEAKNAFQRQFAALEQQALQSQMNPHFIFNCLNSIQRYILTNEKEKANQYLAQFAALIRQTLDISGRQTITVSEEIAYLEKYLQLESLRYSNSFSYAIQADDEVDYFHIPALLLQPYVENSLRHGLSYREDNKGSLVISFSISGTYLVCSVKDNGIGRTAAAAAKSKQHIEYQSKGMSLTSKRIELLNSISQEKILVIINDLQDADDRPAGTLIEVKIPI